MDNIFIAFIIDNRRSNKDNICGLEGGTASTLVRNVINTKTTASVARKAQQFPQDFNA
jgi:hypothetical protein